MPEIKLRKFSSIADFEREAAELLAGHIGIAERRPHAVILPGGRTPLGIYRIIQQESVSAPHSFHIIVSDERQVPFSSPESNYGGMAGMVRALCMEGSQVLRVHTEIPLEEAAYLYNRELAALLRRNGRITLGLLGLGADGHTASLFSAGDVESGSGKYAIAVKRKEGPDRVSVTQDLLLEAERLVFLAAGPEKADAVNRLVNCPDTVPAGLAVAGAPSVEAWYCEQASQSQQG